MFGRKSDWLDHLTISTPERPDFLKASRHFHTFEIGCCTTSGNHCNQAALQPIELHIPRDHEVQTPHRVCPKHIIVSNMNISNPGTTKQARNSSELCNERCQVPSTSNFGQYHNDPSCYLSIGCCSTLRPLQHQARCHHRVDTPPCRQMGKLAGRHLHERCIEMQMGQFIRIWTCRARRLWIWLCRRCGMQTAPAVFTYFKRLQVVKGPVVSYNSSGAAASCRLEISSLSIAVEPVSVSC